jgi:hypothetical protein
MAQNRFHSLLRDFFLEFKRSFCCTEGRTVGLTTTVLHQGYDPFSTGETDEHSCKIRVEMSAINGPKIFKCSLYLLRNFAC